MNFPPPASYLLFTLHDALYAVEAGAVREILPLPALTPVREGGSHLAGMLDLRGQIVPVVDLSARLRLSEVGRCYRVEDAVIVLQHGALVSGIIVNAVQDVRAIGAEYIEVQRWQDGGCIAGLARTQNEIAQLLRLDALLERGPDAAPSAASFCPHATPAERQIFDERARALLPSEALGDAASSENWMPMAAFSLGGEAFALELEAVREFAPLRAVTPVPGSAASIIGLMNLRGEVLTLVDARAVLGLPDAAIGRQVVVVQANGLRLGLPVDEVLEVFRRHANELAPTPAASRQDDDVLRGVAPYQGTMIGVLDLRQLLEKVKGETL